MNDKKIIVLQLYPLDMNIYGDQGNIQTLLRRIEKHGYEPELISHNVGNKLPNEVDIVIGGGGQDSGQEKIHADLLAIGPKLKTWAENDVPMFMVCGLYQLFGHFFKTLNGVVIDGIGILDVKTFGSHERLIGNIVTNSKEFGEIIGYENHSGQTILGSEASPLAKVIKGAGNNAQDGHEGSRYKNVIGTYMHGPALPKNPALADFLITQAAIRKFGKFDGQPIDDSTAGMARDIARNRPR